MSTLSSTAATIVPLAILEFRDRLPEVELSVSILEPPGVLLRICAVQGVKLTRPIVAVMPAG